jgi:sugar lactone lactonase YvrE
VALMRRLVLLLPLLVGCIDFGLLRTPLADMQPTDDGGSSGTLTLLAGKSGGGPGVADGIGGAARFSNPYGVASDGQGNLYVADTSNHTIRKLAVGTQLVTTLAGKPGIPGSQDGTGGSARFSSPIGIVYDPAGNLYVADTSNHAIRKLVIATGAVSTLAGKLGAAGAMDATGTAARFHSPWGLAIDSGGNLFVADTLNETIRQVVIASGAVSTLAGTAGAYGGMNGVGGAARFATPIGIAVDRTGNLWIADRDNHAIRKATLAAGMWDVTTPAGALGMPGSSDGSGAQARFSSPHGIAVDVGGNVYVSDTGNQLIRKFAPVADSVSKLAGLAGAAGSTDGSGAAARFYNPIGVTADNAGNLYIGDALNNAIRQLVVANGAVSTVAGTAASYGNADGPVANVRFNFPSGVASDGNGNLFITDSLNHTIRQMVLLTGMVATIAGSGSAGSGDGTGAGASFNYPWGITFHSTGDLFIADTNNVVIRKLVLAGSTVSTFAGMAGVGGSSDSPPRFASPYAVASDGNANLYVADTSNHTIRQIVVATGAVKTVAGAAGMSGSSDGANARFNTPCGISVDATGIVYVADTYNHTIRQLASGMVTTLAGSAGMLGSADGSGSAARFLYPYAVVPDNAGSLYIADTGNHTIRKLDLTTRAVTTVVGVSGEPGVRTGMLPAGLNAPTGLAVLGPGVVAIVDRNEQVLLVAEGL